MQVKAALAEDSGWRWTSRVLPLRTNSVLKLKLQQKGKVSFRSKPKEIFYQLTSANENSRKPNRCVNMSAAPPPSAASNCPYPWCPELPVAS